MGIGAFDRESFFVEHRILYWRVIYMSCFGIVMSHTLLVNAVAAPVPPAK
jgi:hypothetical protein